MPPTGRQVIPLQKLLKQPEQPGYEFGGAIYQNDSDNTFSITAPKQGTKIDSHGYAETDLTDIKLPGNTTLLGYYFSHVGRGFTPLPSGGDFALAASGHLDLFVSINQGAIVVHGANSGYFDYFCWFDHAGVCP